MKKTAIDHRNSELFFPRPIVFVHVAFCKKKKKKILKYQLKDENNVNNVKGQKRRNACAEIVKVFEHGRPE